MEAIVSWVKSGLIYAVFASIILMMAPNKSYVKHISLVVGLLFILVMVHPVMQFLNLDGKTYISYLEKFFQLETTEREITKEQLTLYEESLGMELMAALLDVGYPIANVEIQADVYGTVTKVWISLSQMQLETDMESTQSTELADLEQYIYSLFGQEVDIVYEYKS
ncbi:MAG: stage III sporulation protein AF [Lachnospiraceae bacterium]|nr:stage III sporulation protein AF [Lachnospiraceae bacterium]